MSFPEGRGYLSHCPHCLRPVILAHCYGLKHRISTKAVPFKDAVTLSKYWGTVLNIWIGETQIWVADWHYTYGRPSRGHLFIQHRCRVWR